MNVWTLAGTVALLLSSTPAAQAGSGAGEPPAAVSRLREAIQRPTLHIPPLPDLPMFRVTVEQTDPGETALEAMRRDLAERPGFRGASAGVGGVDLLGLATGLLNTLNDARRRRAEADARREVEEALAQFCASHDCAVTEPGIGPREGLLVPQKRR